MSIANKLEQVARAADRRFGKGIVCRILGTAVLISFMKRHNIIPPGIIPSIPEGIDTTKGKMFVIPVYNYPELEEELAALGSIKPAPQADPSSSFEQKQMRLQKEFALINFLKQNVIMVSVLKEQWPNPLSLVNNMDVVIDTLDVPQSTNCMFVPRKTETSNDRVKINDK